MADQERIYGGRLRFRYALAKKFRTGRSHPPSAQILFLTPAQAASAVSKLHAHVYKGSHLSVTLKKRLDNLSKPPNALEKGGKSFNAPAPSHASRLIVRNIPFNATEQDLRAIFLPYGPIHSIHIPTDEKHTPASKEEDLEPNDGTSITRKPRMKGFGFVWMLSKKDAEKAIQGCNDTVMRAGTAQSLVLDKQKKKKEKRLEMKRLKAMVSGEREVGSGAGDMDIEEETKATERVIAVDWALSKHKWEEEKTKLEDVKMDVTPESASSASDDDDDGATDEDALGLHSDTESEGDNGGSQVDDEDDEGEKIKPQLPPPETGTTVFVRNIPFDATEDELRTLWVFVSISFPTDLQFHYSASVLLDLCGMLESPKIRPLIAPGVRDLLASGIRRTRIALSNKASFCVQKLQEKSRQ